MAEKRRKILFLNAYYFPGFQSGGPQQTIANVIEAFGDKADMHVLTQNYDMGNKKQYENISVNQWLTRGKGRVMYLSCRNYNYANIKRAYENFEIVYSCSMFEKNMLLVMLVHRLSKEKKKLYIAPMGVFSAGAIRQKWLKKKLYLNVLKWSGLLKDIVWSFTSEIEWNEARMVMGARAVKEYIIAEDIPQKADFDKQLALCRARKKKKGQLRIVFVSRICEKKNLDFCFDILHEITGIRIKFDIYGTIEEKKYWKFCQNKKNALPDTIDTDYLGELNPQDVISVFGKYDIFLFPTKGENYGHVIYESLCAGCLPVISDKTPWTDIAAQKAGSVICLSDIGGFRNAVTEYAEMDGEIMNNMRENAVKLAKNQYKKALKNSGYQTLLALAGGGDTERFYKKIAIFIKKMELFWTDSWKAALSVKV